jgi:alginate O-acetyltransferase complex protein AlgJ
VLAQNDSGAFATRQALARELEGGEDRLAGKRVVVWEFAARELAVGDWKPIDWDSVMGARE